MSTSNAMTWAQTLRKLTEQAGRSAMLGRWDQVEECYRLRGTHLRDYAVLPDLATDLAALDREIAARIVTARAAVEALLIETAKVRRNLHGLRSWQDRVAIESLRVDQTA